MMVYDKEQPGSDFDKTAKPGALLRTIYFIDIILDCGKFSNNY
jgi:hypothetical protein